MSSLLRRKFSAWLEQELDRLENGNKAEQQRYRNTMSAVAKVLSNPLNTDFNKDLPRNFKAVDVLQQYRLFFRIENDSVVGDQVVFFVWINNEDSIHRTGKPDDCYQVFREMLDRGEVETYSPDPKTTGSYKRHDNWGNDYVYLSYRKTISSQPPVQQYADASLSLNKITANEYNLQSVSVSHEDEGLATLLLTELCTDTDTAKITLTHELFTGSENASKSRYLLSKFDFKITEIIDDVEVWQRKK